MSTPSPDTAEMSFVESSSAVDSERPVDSEEAVDSVTLVDLDAPPPAESAATPQAPPEAAATLDVTQDARTETSPEDPLEPAPDESTPGRLGPTGRPTPEFPPPPPVRQHGPARVLAMCNQKGGVGKTTTTINLGAALAEYGRRVLLVDFDPQGALSVGLGFQPGQFDRTVYDLLLERDVNATDVIRPTAVPGLDLLPSNIDLSGAEVELVMEVGREQTLRRALTPILANYDVVLLDCQPSLGLLTVNALAAADGVVIPLECEYFALRGVALLTNTMEKVRARINLKLELIGVLPTMYDARTLHGREVLKTLVGGFGDKVFHTVINRTVRFPETTVAGEPITTYAPSSAGAIAYRQLAREILATALADPAADSTSAAQPAAGS